MEKQNLVKFNGLELEVLTSENELSEVRGGKSIGSIIDSILEGIDIEINFGCNECK